MEKPGVWDSMPELTIPSPYVQSRVDSSTITMGNPMPETTLTLCHCRLYLPVRDFGFCRWSLSSCPISLLWNQFRHWTKSMSKNGVKRSWIIKNRKFSEISWHSLLNWSFAGKSDESGRSCAFHPGGAGYPVCLFTSRCKVIFWIIFNFSLSWVTLFAPTHGCTTWFFNIKVS